MSQDISQALKQQLFAQESSDPFLMLVTLEHTSFGILRYVNNNEDIVSRGNNYTAFPMSITLPSDNGETERTVEISFDNVSLELISQLRSATDRVNCTLELVLASNPDLVEIAYEELKLANTSAELQRISATLALDDFLNTGLTSEKYNPSNFPGIFS